VDLIVAAGYVEEEFAMFGVRVGERVARVTETVATAEVHGGLGQVRIRDAGAQDRLAVLATTRTFPGPGPGPGSPA